MKSDSTASWLLQSAKDASIPIILCEYTVADKDLTRQVTFGQYVSQYIQSTSYNINNIGYSYSKELDYITLFRNLSNNFDIATVLGHEARHMWQDLKFPYRERAALSPIDKIIYNILSEADARAIDSKIAWGIHKKTGLVGKYDDKWRQFERSMAHSSLKNASPQTKIKQATQRELIQWIEQELTNPAYLHSYVAQITSGGANSLTLNRSLSNSVCLSENFLKRVSQIGNTHYLDKEGMELVRKVFVHKLPHALAKLGHRPGSAPRYEAT